MHRFGGSEFGSTTGPDFVNQVLVLDVRDRGGLRPPSREEELPRQDVGVLGRGSDEG